MKKIDDQVQMALGWEGSNGDFYQKVAEPVEILIDKAVEDRRVAPLYRMWSALLQKQLYLKDGHIHLIWNLLDSQKKQLSALEGWKSYVEPVLTGTLAALWPEMQLVLRIHPPEAEKWYEAVFSAMRNGMRDDDAFDAFDALVELVARVFTMDEDGVQGEWATSVAESARAYALRSKCRAPDSDAPIAIYELLHENSNDTEMVQYNASRIVLSMRASTLENFAKNADPFDELAQRIIETLAKEIGSSLKVSQSEVAEFIRHLAFEEKSPITGFLARCTGYQPYVRPTSDHPIEHVDSLELNIMLIGQTEVGKSSFLFASERLPVAGESKEPNPQQGTYPRVDLKHVAGESLEIDRGKWAELLPTRDIFYKLYAETEPFGFYSFNIMDAPGEIVGRSAARRGAEYFDYLPLQIQRLRPSVLALMLGCKSNHQNEEDSHFHNGIERSVQSISKILEENRLKQRTLGNISVDAKLDELIASYPVYVIQNQADKMIELLRRRQGGNLSKEIEQIEEGYRADLARKLSHQSFFLGPYFENVKTIDDAMRALRSDSSLGFGDPAVRDLVIGTCEDRRLFFDILRGAGFRNVNLVFVSSLPKEMAEPHSQHVGVEAFWRHLWTESTKLFSEALEKKAQRFLVDDLKAAIRKIESRCDKNYGINLPPVPSIDEPAMLEAFRSLINNEDAILYIKQNFDPRRKLRDQMLDISSGWESAMTIVGKFEHDVSMFMKSWSSVLRRLIAELNVPPEIACGDLRTVELSKGEIDWLQYARAQLVQNATNNEDAETDTTLRKQITESDVHGFFGSLRHSSILREIYETNAKPGIDAGEALRWLDNDRSKTLLERVESVLGRNSDDPYDEVLGNALRLVSDWGIDLIESTVYSNPVKLRSAELDNRSIYSSSGESEPSYHLLAVRRYERNRFLLQFHFKANSTVTDRSPADRIEKVIGLVKKMGKIRANLESRNGLQAEIRHAVEGLALSMMLKSLKFDVGKIRDSEDSKEVLTKVEDTLRKALDNRKFLLFEDIKSIREVIQSQETNLDNHGFRIAGDGLILPIGKNFAECRAAYNILVFSRQAVEVAEHTGNLIALENEKDGVDFAIGTLKEKLGNIRRVVDDYERDLILYLEATLRIFLDMHYQFVLQTGLVKKDDSNTRMMLSKIVNQEFESVVAKSTEVSGRLTLNDQLFQQKIKKQIKLANDFSDIIQALIQNQVAKSN